MTDHDDDAPDVDYEADEQEEEEEESAEQPTEFPIDIGPEAVGNEQDAKTDAKARGDQGGDSKDAAASSGSAKPKSGAGDSETEDDSDDDEAVGPRPPSAAVAVAKSKGAGDSETDDSSSDGEIHDDRRDRSRSDGRRGRSHKDRSHSRSRSRSFSSDRKDKQPSSRSHDKHDGNRNVPSHDERDDAGPSRGYGNVPAANANEAPPVENRRVIKPCLEENIGVYIPPAKRRLLEMERNTNANSNNAANGKSNADNNNTAPPVSTTPVHIQRQSWENLKRTINGTINRLSPQTIKPLIHSLFQKANLVRGRGILARSLLRASQASPQYAPAYAALMAVINTKLPECGELLLVRAILAFRRGYKTRDRNVVSSTLALLGHLFNQGMAHELLSLQILTVLLDGDPTEDSVDVAVGYMCVVGRALTEVSPAGVHAVMERFRGLLHEGTVGRRAQYRIEALLKIKKEGFRDYPTIPDDENLDLVEREDQITFEIGLDDEGLKKEEGLDVFKYDAEFDEREREWERIRAEILGEDSSDDESGSGSGSDEDSSSDSEDEKEVPDQELDVGQTEKKTVVIEDLTETDLVHLRRTIYLTIMSSATFEECTHKLAKMDIPQGRESELINMIIECCSQERTFLRYYGLISGRFCLLNERWQDAFEEAFATQYNTIHRLETNKLRNVAKLFGHLLHTDSISWSVLSVIHLNEDETTSSSRIFIKILIQEMAEAMGMVTLKDRFDTDNPDPDMSMVAGEDSGLALTTANGKAHPSSREWFKGMFPKDNARNTRYAINFFTSIGLGPLTDGMREFLKNAPKLILAQAQAMAAKEAQNKNDDDSSVLSTSSSSTSSFNSSSSSSFSSSSSSSYTSSSSYSSYSSDSRSGRRDRGGRRSRRSRSYSSSSSGSDSSLSSRDDQRKKRGGKKNEKSRDRSLSRDSASDSSRDRKGDRGKFSSDSKEKKGRDHHGKRSRSREKSSGRRGVSASPAYTGRKGRSSKESDRDRSRSTSSSPGRRDSRHSNGKHRRRSHSRDRSRSPRDEKKRSSSPPRESNKESSVTENEQRGRTKRGRSSSYSSRSRSSSLSRHDDKKSKDSKTSQRDEGRKRSRRSRRSSSRSNSSGRS